MERFTRQSVHERVQPLGGGLFDDARRHRLVEQVEQVVLVVAGDLDEEVEVELAPDDRRGAERAAGSFGKVLDPPSDHLLHAVGHAQRLEREPSARVRGTDLVDVAADLPHEERIALRLPAHAPHELGIGREGASDEAQPSDVALVETRELDLLDRVVTAQLGDQRAERMVVGHLLGAERAEDQEPRRIPAAREMGQQRERGPVGPVQVFEHDQHRRRGAQRAEQVVDRLEHEVALRVGFGLHRFGEVGEVAGHVGHEPGEVRARTHEVGPHLGGGRGAEIPADRFHEGLVGDDVLLVAATGQHRRAFVVQDARELDRDAGLPHPRVASEEHDMTAVTGVRLRPPRSQRRQLRLATDERRVSLERRRERDRRRAMSSSGAVSSSSSGSSVVDAGCSRSVIRSSDTCSSRAMPASAKRPTSCMVTSAGSCSAISSAVACDMYTWPPSREPRMRAARLTAAP